MLLEGNCRQCGAKSDGCSLCPKCRKRVRERARKNKGCLPWVPGGRGRPPAERVEEYRLVKLNELTALMDAKLRITEQNVILLKEQIKTAKTELGEARQAD